LTTVRQDFAAVGQASIRLLVSRLESSGLPDDERVVIEPRLIVRSSSTPT
jgi:DNA-binding LacI/PurR family transcriptional regulator